MYAIEYYDQATSLRYGATLSNLPTADKVDRTIAECGQRLRQYTKACIGQPHAAYRVDADRQTA
jgi:hypothetical protein